MGKKRLPLRQLAKAEGSKVSRSSTVACKIKTARGPDDGNKKELKGLGKKQKDQKGKKDTGGKITADDDDEWAKIEARDAAAAAPSDSDDDDESASSNGSGNDDEDEDIKLQGAVEHISQEFTFEFNDMRDDFANGICTLLRSLVVNPTDAYTLSCAISAQTIVGTAIVCEGEHDVFAFATVLPIARQKTGPLFQMLQHLRQGLVALSSAERRSPGIELMTECVSGAQGGVTGIFIHQRFANLPLELISHLHKNLDEDLGWAQQLHASNSDGNAAQEASDFKSLQFVILLACCDLQGGASQSKPDLSGSAVVDVSGNPSLLFHNFEDEAYFQEAISTVLFKPRQSEHTLCASLIPVASLRKCSFEITKLVTGGDEKPQEGKKGGK